MSKMKLAIMFSTLFIVSACGKSIQFGSAGITAPTAAKAVVNPVPASNDDKQLVSANATSAVVAAPTVNFVPSPTPQQTERPGTVLHLDATKLAQIKPTVKVVLVVDNSNSMSPKQQKLSNALAGIKDAVKGYNVNFYIYTTTAGYPLSSFWSQSLGANQLADKPTTSQSVLTATDGNPLTIPGLASPVAFDPKYAAITAFIPVLNNPYNNGASLQVTADMTDAALGSFQSDLTNAVSAVGQKGANNVESGIATMFMTVAQNASVGAPIFQKGDNAAFVILSDSDDHSDGHLDSPAPGFDSSGFIDQSTSQSWLQATVNSSYWGNFFQSVIQKYDPVPTLKAHDCVNDASNPSCVLYAMNFYTNDVVITVPTLQQAISNGIPVSNSPPVSKLWDIAAQCFDNPSVPPPGDVCAPVGTAIWAGVATGGVPCNATQRQIWKTKADQAIASTSQFPDRTNITYTAADLANNCLVFRHTETNFIWATKGVNYQPISGTSSPLGVTSFTYTDPDGTVHTYTGATTDEALKKVVLDDRGDVTYNFGTAPNTLPWSSGRSFTYLSNTVGPLAANVPNLKYMQIASDIYPNNKVFDIVQGYPTGFDVVTGPSTNPSVFQFNQFKEVDAGAGKIDVTNGFVTDANALFGSSNWFVSAIIHDKDKDDPATCTLNPNSEFYGNRYKALVTAVKNGSTGNPSDVYSICAPDYSPAIAPLKNFVINAVSNSYTLKDLLSGESVGDVTILRPGADGSQIRVPLQLGKDVTVLGSRLTFAANVLLAGDSFDVTIAAQ